MGLGSKSYIVPQEGTDFGQNLLNGDTFADAFFDAACSNQDFGILSIPQDISAKLYRILYYGPDNGGTLNDTIVSPLVAYQNTGGKIKDVEINKYWYTDFKLY